MKRLVSCPARSSAISSPAISMGRERCGFAALGRENLADGAQVERVGHQRVQGVGGDSHHLAAADGGGGALQHFRLRPFRIDLDQVGCHRSAIRLQRGPMASATSRAIW